MNIDNATRAHILARTQQIRERMTAFSKKPGRRERAVVKLVNEIEEVIK